MIKNSPPNDNPNGITPKSSPIVTLLIAISVYGISLIPIANDNPKNNGPKIRLAIMPKYTLALNAFLPLLWIP